MKDSGDGEESLPAKPSRKAAVLKKKAVALAGGDGGKQSAQPVGKVARGRGKSAAGLSKKRGVVVEADAPPAEIPSKKGRKA